MLASAAIVITLPRESGIRTFVASTILRLIFSVGPEPTLWLLGFVTVKKNIYIYMHKTCTNDILFYLFFFNALHLHGHLLLQIMLKVVHLISIIGNQGTLTRSVEQIITNIELLYHLLYLAFCVLGIFMHPFFYSVLVSSWIPLLHSL